jgi:cysteine desulfurase/selenocysteine lyase
MIFPILKDIIYLDNAATTQKPQRVIDKVKEYYEKYNSNIHRGLYDLSEKSTQLYENARKEIAEMINAGQDEIIFTKGATESANFLATTLKNNKDIVLTEMEHHANIVPWQQTGRKIKYIKIERKGGSLELDYEDAKEKIDERTGIVSIIHASNVLGTINEVERITTIAKEKGAITVIDASQTAGHMQIDVKKIGCDFLFFSGHKMFAGTGIGILYGKKELLEKIRPYQYGGDMVEEVTLEGASWAEIPTRFEAGTPNIAGAISLGEAAKLVKEYGIIRITRTEKELAGYCIQELRKLDGTEIYSSQGSKGVVSFNLKGIHPHDVAGMLNEKNICVRAGQHCCHPLIKKLGVAGTVRASFTIYNTKEDIDKMIEALKEVKKTL